MSYESTRAPIYPVPVKPRSGIVSWEGWPADVRATLAEWNRGTRARPMKLTFSSSGGVFKCFRCDAFCESHATAANLNGDFYCDDCMIRLVRAGQPGGEQ